MHFISIWKSHVEGMLNINLDSIVNAKGFIGVIFTNSISRFLFMAIAAVVAILAIIGLITVIVWTIKLKRKKKA